MTPLGSHPSPLAFVQLLPSQKRKKLTQVSRVQGCSRAQLSPAVRADCRQVEGLAEGLIGQPLLISITAGVC